MHIPKYNYKHIYTLNIYIERVHRVANKRFEKEIVAKRSLKQKQANGICSESMTYIE